MCNIHTDTPWQQQPPSLGQFALSVHWNCPRTARATLRKSQGFSLTRKKAQQDALKNAWATESPQNRTSMSQKPHELLWSVHVPQWDWAYGGPARYLAIFFMFWKWGYVKRWCFFLYINLYINSVLLALWHIFVTSDFFYVQHFLSLVLQCCGRTVGLFCNLMPPDSLTPQQVKVMTWLSRQHHLTSELNNSKVIPLCSRLPSRFPKQHCCCASVFTCISKNRWHTHSCSFVAHI